MGNRARPDENNPRGYFEVDLAKGLARNNRWLHDCDGKAVKVVTPLIRHLPQAIDYKVIHMLRRSTRSSVAVPDARSGSTRRVPTSRTNRWDRNHGTTCPPASMLKIHGRAVLPIDYADVLRRFARPPLRSPSARIWTNEDGPGRTPATPGRRPIPRGRPMAGRSALPPAGRNRLACDRPGWPARPAVRDEREAASHSSSRAMAPGPAV